MYGTVEHNWPPDTEGLTADANKSSSSAIASRSTGELKPEMLKLSV
jgi:hypothetical protein